MCVRVSGSVVDSPPHNTGRKQRGEVPQLCCSHISPRVAEACQVFHLAWQKRVRFSHLHVPRGASIRLPKKNFCVRLSVTSFENLLKALQHLFVIFFDDMIEQKKVTQGSHVRLLCYGVLWTVFEEKAYFMSESEKERRHLSGRWRHRAWTNRACP